MLKYLFFICSISVSLVSWAQTPEVILTTGHTDQINTMDISADGRLLASGGLDKQVKIWDVASAKELRALTGNDRRASYLKFDRHGKYLAALFEAEQIKLWDVKTGKLLLFLPTSSTVEQFDFAFDDTKLVVLTSSQEINVIDVKDTSKYKFPIEYAFRFKVNTQGNKVYVLTLKGEMNCYDLKDGKLLSSVKLFDKGMYSPTRMDMDRTGKYLTFCHPENNNIFIFDVTQNKITQTLKGHDIRIVDLKFEESGNRLISIDHNTKLMVWDPATGKKLFDEKFGYWSVGCIETHPTENIFLLSDNKQIHYFNGENFVEIKTFKSLANKQFNMSYDGQGNYLATASADISVKVWDLRYNKIVHKLGGFFPCKFTPDGKGLVTMHYTLKLMLWDPATGKEVRAFDTESELIQNLSFSADGKYMAGAGWNGMVKIWDVESGKLIKRFTGHAGGIYSTAFSPDGKYVASAGLDQTVRVFDFKSEKEVANFHAHEVIASDVEFTPDGKFLVSSGWDRKVKVWNTSDWSLYKTMEGHVNIILDINISPDSKYVCSASGNNSVSPTDNTIRVWEIASGREVCRFENPAGQINKAEFDETGEIIYSCGEDGMAKIWDVKDCREKAAFIAVNTTDHLIVTPDHYYMCSKDALAGVSFRVEDKLYSFEQFDLQYNRPDLVSQKTGKTPANLVQAYAYLYNKRLKKFNMDEKAFSEEFHMPKVNIYREGLRVATEDPAAKIKVKISDSKYELKSINVVVNGVPVNGIAGMDISPLKTKEYNEVLSIPLMSGVNKIQVSAVNEKGVESFTETIEMVREFGKLETKPNLYVVVVGVSEYNQKEFNLKYPSKDARDMMNTFLTSQAGYENIYTHTLLNTDVTAGNFMKVEEFLKNCKPDDIVVIFMAGHGVLDKKFDYYFCTADIDFSNPEKSGIAYSMIEQVMEKCKAFNKLLIMDTCHSGELDKDDVASVNHTATSDGEVKFRSVGMEIELNNPLGLENTNHLLESMFGDTRKGTGATAISSAGGAEFAMESDNWNNGLFTYVLINGLQTKSADTNKNGVVNVSELRSFVYAEVNRLSNGKQRPTTRTENLNLDFRIW